MVNFLDSLNFKNRTAEYLYNFLIDFDGLIKQPVTYRVNFMKNFFLKSGLLIVLLLVLQIPSCSSKYGLEHRTEAIEKLTGEIKTERCANARTRFMDMAVSSIEESDWEKLLTYEPFSHQKKSSIVRIPKILFFQAVLVNTGDTPVLLEDISFILTHDGREEKPIPADLLAGRFKSPAYSAFNFSNILSPKRLINEKNCINEINYENDLIDYKFSFLSPGDRLIKIFAFEWQPVEHRSFTLKLSIKYGAMQKIIDFDFVRSEYRTKGRHFLKPETPKEEFIP